MKLKVWLIVFVVLCVLIFTGCSKAQLENMNILTTYYADKSGNEIILGGGVANVRTLSDSMADEPVSLIYAKGDSVREAGENLEKSADHPLFFGGVRAVVVSKEMAESGIDEFIESLRENYKLRSECMFFVTRANPDEIITHKAINDFTGGFAAESMLKALAEEGKITYTTLSDVFETSSVKKAALAVACVDTDDDILRFGGYAIFENGKLKEFADDKVSQGINLFLNKNSTYDFYIDAKKYTAKKTGEHKKARFENGRLCFDIEFEFELSSADDKAKATAENEIKSQAYEAYNLAKETGSDFLELYRVYQKDYRYEFESADYRAELKNSKAQIEIKLR